ncbi:helix-turn-helix domain containing protein [Microbacterium betulae]|uniref:Helix-turn-helix domain containing protein n=1 Tax=Microbacterium betulae TaxID=2981139 RepID=A0AA97FHQ6_9MICO|nr:helix-turn-helix domain-containing protein [Microbacterium sp. AB]WOF22520.1 helix-turn-helix domain containing protein [Microbacterium sp. AB]
MAESSEGVSRRNRGPAAAAENRRALIDAAREIFSEQGLAAPFSAIARRAGVGQGSLYRHFPTKIELAVAVFEDNIDDLEHVARAADATLDDLFDSVVAQAKVSAAFVDAVAAARDVPAVQRIGARMISLIGALVDRGRATGALADDIGRDDVMLVVAMLARTVADAPAGEREAVARRARSVFSLGLMPRG